MTENAQAAEQHTHPSTGTYLVVAGVLTVITLVEIGVFYVPAFQSILAPVLMILSGTKFALVVMFYMHLKTDHRLFTAAFALPLLIAIAVIVALLFLFGAFSLG
ncbi:MAG: cytochrome C oxidase subunit IV family protein [Gemmatimonadota bacterium]|nr:MAG: cytochrome C oxidase subunit IV family protein [Gemmatimonadota bacterium]